MNTDPLTLEQLQALRAMFDNAALISGLRKIWADEVAYWLDALRREALSDQPNAQRQAQFAARAKQAEEMERVIRKAVSG